MGFEYDPYNRLRHTTYWYEYDVEKEWPLSENAAREPRHPDNAPFDYNAKPERFYFDVEVVGSLTPAEVVMNVGWPIVNVIFRTLSWCFVGTARTDEQACFPHSSDRLWRECQR